MAKVIGLSGPQGGGKSTLLNGLKEKGFVVDDFKVSREVQKRLSWESLARVTDDAETLMTFQATVLNVKQDRELDNLSRTDVEIILTERTFADISCYNQLWAEKLLMADKWNLEEATEWTIQTYRDAGGLQYLYVGNIFLPSMPNVVFEDDPHRAKSEDIAEFQSMLIEFFESWHPVEIPVFHVSKESVQDRIDETYRWLTA